MKDLVVQFEDFLNRSIGFVNKNINRLEYRVSMLPTTIYNYKDMSKLYKEQTSLGFSKLLPQVALGQPQSIVMATAYFENDMLHLDEVFVPPMSSNTISNSGNKVNDDTEASGGAAGGRPEKPDEQKTEKTIQNRESAN